MLVLKNGDMLELQLRDVILFQFHLVYIVFEEKNKFKKSKSKERKVDK